MYAYSQTGLTNLPRRYHVTSTEKLQSTLFCRSGWRGSGLGRMNLVVESVLYIHAEEVQQDDCACHSYK